MNLYHLNKYQYQTYENDYAYFSLHVEPEISTLVWAPLFTNQIELIRKIALSLPNGLKLLVKEHPYMFGKRNINYYKKIESIPNVRLIDHQIQTEKIINNNKCKAVFVISGTSGFEAMLRGKIVFLFSKMFYDFLENVFYVNNLNNISKILKSNMNHNFLDSKKFNKNILKLISFLYENSVEIPYSMAYKEKIDISPLLDKFEKEIFN